MSRRLHFDYETFSLVDLKSAGVSRYARDPSTEILMLAYAFDDDPVTQWVPERDGPLPADFRDALTDPAILKIAFNAQFEWAITEHVLAIRIPFEQLRCAMVQCYACSLPGSLEQAGEVISLAPDKKKSSRGKLLVRKFCCPRKPTKTKPWARATPETDPEDWAEFLDYNRQDVVAERAVWSRLSRWAMPEHEWSVWALDQKINTRGIPIALDVVSNAIEIAADIFDNRIERMRVITGLDNPNSGAQLLPWLQDRGYRFDDLKKGHVSKALEETNEGDNSGVRAVLEMRQEISKSSVKKYNALDAATDSDGFLRNAFQFAGAQRTWRWAGRKYQAQNLARPVPYLEKASAQIAAVECLRVMDLPLLEFFYPKPMDVLSTCVRPVVQAPKGKVFVDADLNAIENRVLGWISGDEKILDVFRNGRCPYVDFATYMFGGKYEDLYAEYKAGNKTKRTTSKPAVLGCGYMLGPGEAHENHQTGETEASGLLGYAWNMGVTSFTQEQSTLSVRVWRETFTAVVDCWYALDRAFRRCIKTKQPQEVGPLRFDVEGPFLRMWLPSGRALHYCRPQILPRRTPWGEIRPTVTYEGLNDKNQWVRLTTHPGKIMENADQAISRDLLAHGMMNAAREGLDIRLHVHDQIVALAPESRAEEKLKLLIECMTDPPRWGRDIPLGAEGTSSRYFIKD